MSLYKELSISLCLWTNEIYLSTIVFGELYDAMVAELNERPQYFSIRPKLHIVRRLKPHLLVNRAFCDTSTKFGTELE